MNANEMPTSEVLNRAADLIEERGWGRGNEAMRMDGAPICLEGGIAAAIGAEATMELTTRDGEPIWIASHYDAVCPAYAAVKSYLGDRCRNALNPHADKADLWEWNDTIAKSAAEVVEVLRATAVIEAARENAADRESVTR